MADVKRINAMQQVIEEEILNEIVYVEGARIMKILKLLEVAGRVLLAGVLIVGNVIMNVIGLIISAITSQK